MADSVLLTLGGNTVTTESGLGLLIKPLPGAAAPNFSDAVVPGRADQKYVVYFGLASADGSKISLVPQGTYLAETTDGGLDRGVSAPTGLHGYDISKEFVMTVNADIPHVLYGNQSDIRYDAKYNLTNPSADLRTWVCDAKKFMTQKSDNAQFSADFNFLFGNLSASPVNVFVGSPGTPATTPTAATNYTWNPDTGTVVFTANQSANAVISIDGVPQAMAPELMMRHLFLDYGQWDPNYLNLQTSNTLIPTYTGGRGSSVWQIANDIAAMTSPRLVPWQVRMDEFGNVMFYETKYSSTPVETLVDDRDLFNIKYTYTSSSLSNVWRATATANNGQQLVSISADIKSITDNGQKAVQDVSSNLLYSISGMNPGPGISFMNLLTASKLWQNSRPTLELTCDLIPNWNRQVGDRVTIIERSLGLSGPYIYKGITKKISSGGVASQQARFQKAIIGANYNMGIPSAVSNAIQNTAAVAPTVNGTTNIILNLSINGTLCISNGNIVRDTFGNPVIPIVSALTPWVFSATLSTANPADSALFHFIYLESANSISSTSMMAIQGTGFGDGNVIPAASVSGGYTATSTHATGTIIGSGENGYLYNNIVLSATQNQLPSGYSGIYATLTNTTGAAAYLGATTQYGVAYGLNYTSGAWYPNLKQNFGYIIVQAASANGGISIIRQPFILGL